MSTKFKRNNYCETRVVLCFSKNTLFCSQTLNSETMESQTGCRSVEPTLCWALFRKLARPSLRHHHHHQLTIIINNNIITSAIIIHTYAHRCTSLHLLFRKSCTTQEIGTCIFLHCSLCSAHFNFLFWVSDLLCIFHILTQCSSLSSLICRFNFTIITIIPLLRISHVRAKFSSLSFIIDTLNFTIITLLCISRTECCATYSDPHVSQNWSRVHIPKNSFRYLF